jgi:hypothetical protein
VLPVALAKAAAAVAAASLFFLGAKTLSGLICVLNIRRVRRATDKPTPASYSKDADTHTHTEPGCARICMCVCVSVCMRQG